MKKLLVKIETLSPLHLGAGKADIIIDAEVVHDEYGIPYFPAKRFKGLLYESALEIAEISSDTLIKKAALDKLFGHADGIAGFAIDNLTVADYEKQRNAWKYLNAEFKGYFNEKSVLETYTELRFSTKINKKTGTAEDGSLRNIRLVDKGIVFTGVLELADDSKENLDILKRALANLRYAGAKRNRGCGHIKCTMTEEGRK